MGISAFSLKLHSLKLQMHLSLFVFLKLPLLLLAFFPALCLAQLDTPEVDLSEQLKFSSNGLVYSPSDDYSVKLSGRAQYDRSIFNSNETPLEDFEDFRRLRLKAVIKKSDSWKIQYSYDFESEANTDAFIDFTLTDKSSLTIGQFKTRTSLTSRTSSNWESFTERAPLHARILNERGLGVGTSYDFGKTVVTGHVLTETLDNSSEGRYPWQLSGFVAHRPVLESDRVLHFGLGYVYQINDETDSFSLSTRTSTNSNESGLVGGTLEEVKNYQIVNTEFVYLDGPFDIRTEFAVFNPSESSSERSREAYSFYTSLSYFLNGGSSKYSSRKANFGRPNIPESNWGIWELALRYNLGDQTNSGLGRLSEGTVALNCHLSQNIRLSANLNYSDIELASDPDEEILGGQLRAQLVF